MAAAVKTKPGPLARQAASYANRDVGTAQKANTLDAASKARNVNAAARAASGYLQGLGLGAGLAGSFRTAGKDQAALGAGFSGDVRSTVDAEAAKVNRGLAAIGAPGPLASTSAKAANVVYALGGQIPASSLLAEAPLALADANLAPRSLLGQGLQTAQGIQGAAAVDNRQLEAQLPDLTMKYLSSLRSDRQQQRQQQFQNNLALRQVQNDEDAAAQSRTDAVNAARAEASQPDGALSSKVGYLVNSAGQAIPGADGQPQLLPGNVIKNGRVVKASSSSSSTGGLTRTQRLKASGTALTLADTARNGYGPKLLPDGTPNPKHLEPLTYQQAVLEAEKEGLPPAIYIPALNRFYPPAARVSGSQLTNAAGTAAASIGSASGFGPATPVYVVGKPGGLLAAGNVDLSDRPVAHNKNGSISTVRSITITDDKGRAILIPTVVNGKVVSDKKAIAYWRRTGQNLGTFNNEKAADAYAVKLHNAQAKEYLP